MSEKLTCECGWHGTNGQVLKAPHPFDPTDDVWGCPQCRQIGTFSLACDEPDCWFDVSCGTPTASGYRKTCSQHRPSEPLSKG